MCRLIEKAGGKAIRAPMLAIATIENVAEPLRILRKIVDYDWAIFVSANAVRYAVRLLGTPWPDGGRVKIAAIGEATARELANRGVTVDLRPKQQFNSEALLALPDWAQVAGKRFLIVRGQGGRELLADSLRERGGEVDYAEVYRRVRPVVDLEKLLPLWRSGGVAVVTLTSGGAMENLAGMMPEEDLTLLLGTPLVVFGERLADIARLTGYQNVYVAGASDSDILDALVRIAQTLQSKNSNL